MINENKELDYIELYLSKSNFAMGKEQPIGQKDCERIEGTCKERCIKKYSFENI